MLARAALTLVLSLGLWGLGVGCSFDGSGIQSFFAADLPANAADQSPAQRPDRGVAPDSSAECDPQSCTYGCLGIERCKRLMPSTVDPRTLYELGTAKLWLQGETEINAEEGTVDGLLVEGVAHGVVHQRAVDDEKKKVALFVVDSLRVEAGAHVRFTGNLPVVIVSRTSVTIAGLLDVGARRTTPGPGGRTGGARDGGHASGCDNGAEGGKAAGFGVQTDGGGGGGGWGSAGASGGTGLCPPSPGAAGGRGGAAAKEVSLKPLSGGCGGAGGSGPDFLGPLGADVHGGAGGAGGGAIQISANESITIEAEGGITAGGGGGGVAGFSGGGGGGGSGGSILLEANAVKIFGLLAANGGSGGGGGPGLDEFFSEDGKNGAFSEVPAKGGSAEASGTDGGNGAAGATPAADGFHSVGLHCNGGGGGGGAGVIVINSNALPAGKSSPPFSTGLLPANPW